jgi:hypothetical protein
MDIQLETPCEQDAEALRQVYNKAFYADFLKYGICPGYGRTVDHLIVIYIKNLPHRNIW